MKIGKPILIDLFYDDFKMLIWKGKRVNIRHIFRFLGYPLRVSLSNMDLTQHVLNKVKTTIQLV